MGKGKPRLTAFSSADNCFQAFPAIFAFSVAGIVVSKVCLRIKLRKGGGGRLIGYLSSETLTIGERIGSGRCKDKLIINGQDKSSFFGFGFGFVAFSDFFFEGSVVLAVANERRVVGASPREVVPRVRAENRADKVETKVGACITRRMYLEDGKVVFVRVVKNAGNG